MSVAPSVFTGPRFVFLGFALGSALHAAWPVFDQWFWCESGQARFYECLLLLFEERGSRAGSLVFSLGSLVAWLVLTFFERRARGSAGGP